MKLLFIRHAESVGNREKRMQGHMDFELSTRGKLQAKKLAQNLQTASWQPSHIYSSPLKRAAQTSQILLTAFRPESAVTSSAQVEIKIHYEDALKELDNGIFQGLTWSEAQTRHADLCRALEASPEWISIPGAESLLEVRDRAHRFIQTLFAHHSDLDQIWIITHGGILQYLIAELLGCERVWGLSIYATALFEFWLDLSRWPLTGQNLSNTTLWKIRRFNDTQHLREALNE
jgi:broad specificity phosphatase PhoE